VPKPDGLAPFRGLGVKGPEVKLTGSKTVDTKTMASDMFYGASAHLFEQAKKLRASMTLAETTLWDRLRANQLNGYRFKSQHPIAFFVADFYNHATRLVVELDGGVHDSVEQQDYDANRTYMLEDFGITVIRFRNEDVFNDIDSVLRTIMETLNTLQRPAEKPPTP
jgi:very-short-patch-repair endonuclease